MQGFDANQLIRPNIANLNSYTPILPFEVLSQQLGRDPAEIVKLDANENPYGPSPRVIEALAAASYLHIYPDPESRALRSALADYTGVDAQQLLVGHGADELIDLVMRLVIEPGDKIVNCPPTFGMYAFDAGINDARVTTVWRNADFSIPVEAVEALFQTNPESTSLPKLIFVTSPNNPDGSLLSDADLRRLLALPAITILDEAYIEFGGNSRIGWVEKHRNLIVLRTFSKWAGLAGLRVGYGAFPDEIVNHLWKIKQPYNVNVAGQIAALASLQDRGKLLEIVAQIVSERERLVSILRQFDWLKPYPSHANFVLCQVSKFSAAEVKQRLAEQGILVRHYNSPRLTDYIRISVGTAEQTTRLEQGLRTIR
jgi:histidinol-phosphate aminotransferase